MDEKSWVLNTMKHFCKERGREYHHMAIPRIIASRTFVFCEDLFRLSCILKVTEPSLLECPVHNINQKKLLCVLLFRHCTASGQLHLEFYSTGEKLGIYNQPYPLRFFASYRLVSLSYLSLFEH